MSNPISARLRDSPHALHLTREAADHIDAQDAKIKALAEAAEPYISPVRTADYGAQMKQHQALVSALAAAKEPTPMKCAECDCGGPPNECTWIAAKEPT